MDTARFRHSTPVVYKDDFNKVVDRFFATSYRIIDGEGRFFKPQQTLTFFRLLQEEKEVFFFRSKSY